ncbi:FecR protein [Labrenzia sp. THAF82]|uniref:FecR family protein n=1 Tax=Labrenzia sp. THAF82 TaxID=2587861 RepID=UPI0012696B33|nr:FecR family protein [Labrenzia sp. THAF82]QFT32529.1 FecR protein [Labrenzia sp. THAF82]
MTDNAHAKDRSAKTISLGFTFDAVFRELSFILAAATFVVSVFVASEANAQDWVIKRVSGVAYFVAPGVQAFRVKRGMVFEKGYTIGTRPGARALIARGSETISVGPNTTFAISKHRSRGTKTTLLQRKGNIEVDVKTRRRNHFTVETPFLAAVVKGTKFGVSVNAKRARVSVQRGLVSVEDFASGDRANVGAGQSASSAPAAKVGLQVGGKTKPVVRPGSKRAPSFQTPQTKNVPSADVSPNAGGGFFSNFFSGNGNSGNSGNGNGNSNGNSGNSGNGNGNSNGNSGNSGNGNGNSNGNSGNSGNGNGNSNGNSGNSGNGNGNSNGNSGNSGNGNGNSNGNSGNGNGNGNSNGNGKK